jgi:hypothetical protein
VETLVVRVCGALLGFTRLYFPLLTFTHLKKRLSRLADLLLVGIGLGPMGAGEVGRSPIP